MPDGGHSKPDSNNEIEIDEENSLQCAVADLESDSRTAKRHDDRDDSVHACIDLFMCEICVVRPSRVEIQRGVRVTMGMDEYY